MGYEMDTVNAAIRSRMMASIKAKNTSPELKVRKMLHFAGYRFRLHQKSLPGKPDIVLKKHKLCIFVNGCFWHRHIGCKYTTFPKTRVEFWEKKFTENVVRDRKNVESLLEQGWRVFILWECGIKNRMHDFEPILHCIPDRSKAYITWPSNPNSENQ